MGGSKKIAPCCGKYKATGAAYRQQVNRQIYVPLIGAWHHGIKKTLLGSSRGCGYAFERAVAKYGSGNGTERPFL